jgi:hypothetical protein
MGKPFGNLTSPAEQSAKVTREKQGPVPHKDPLGVNGKPVDTVPENNPPIPWPPAGVAREEHDGSVDHSAKKPFKI